MKIRIYACYAASQRVPDKKYPAQIIKGLAGRIDESGFHRLSKAFVDTGHIVVRECGFTNFLLKTDVEDITVETMQKIRAAHWNIEMQHWLLDIQLKEDQQTARRDDAVMNSSILR